jgi:hypothetical protein
MSVTGVVIVIALLLALQIDKFPDPGGANGNEENSLAPADELAGLETELQQAQRILATFQTNVGRTDSLREVNINITSLISSIERLTRQKEKRELKLKSEIVDPQRQLEMEKIAELKLESKQRLQELQNLDPENAKLSAILRELEKVANKNKGGGSKKENNTTAVPQDLNLKPGQSTSSLGCLMVDVTSQSLTVFQFGGARSKRMQTAHEFKGYCKGVDSSKYYVVFFVRPSGASRITGLIKIAKDAGIKVGYDAIGEKVNLKFGAQ